jgi:diaminohydroxyphosphoribosylaminopyrimidine deaminase/5-amino-6-(5-phosphoribosylamino)uracil reductase
MTLDGKIGTSAGHSAWVTGAEARFEVQRLRAACDAVVVGGNTVRCDNPKLTCRDLGSRNPLRVVLSRCLDLPGEAHLWDTEVAPTLVLTEVGANPEVQKWLANRGVDVVELAPLTPASAMAYFYDRQFLSVLWECGGTLAAPAIADGSVQKVLAFIAPKIVGGHCAPTPVGDLGLAAMTDALALRGVTVRPMGADCLVEGYLTRSAGST